MLISLPIHMTLTCPSPPFPSVSGDHAPANYRSPPAWCTNPRPVPDWHNTGAWRLLPCGRMRCSRQCRDLWARRMSAALRLSFQLLAPTHFVRVRVMDPIEEKDLAACVGRFLRGLRKRKCDYFSINEWHEGLRHHHILGRTDVDLSPAKVAELWQASCGNVRTSSYCRAVRSADATARYVVKDVKAWWKKELPPAEFTGSVCSYSKRFLARPLKILMREVMMERRDKAISTRDIGV